MILQVKMYSIPFPSFNGDSRNRVVGLDLLRISLAFLIFMFHSHIHILHCDYGIFNGFVRMGAIAMTGFFMLSGYALTLSTGKQNMADIKDVKNFYLKRLIAIIPLYYTYALINVAINIATNGGGNVAKEELLLFPIEALGLQTIFASLFNYSHNGGSWFISCILICYFIFPLIKNLTKDISDNTRIKIIVVLSVILLWGPIVQHHFHTCSIYENPFFRLFEFTIGILVCQVNMSQEINILIVKILRSYIACFLTILVLIFGVSIAFRIGVPADFMLYNWIALPCFISLLFSLGYIKLSGLQGSKIVQYLSAISYSLFLSQLLIVWKIVKDAMDTIGLNSNIANILLSATICFTIANILHYFIEKPSSRYLKTKFLK